MCIRDRFVSATLSVDNKMEYFTDTLGINTVENTKKIIEPIYNYKNRVQVIRPTDIGGYKSCLLYTSMQNRM